MIQMEDFFNYLRHSPTAVHAAAASAEMAEAAGGRELRLEDPWDIEAGRLYYLRRGGFFASFRTGKRVSWDSGFSICAAHTDSPALKLKYGAGKQSGAFLRVPVEQYGGAILSSWLDRELSVAGTVATAGGSVSFVTAEPAALIPNLAIHLNREVNEGYSYNRQEELQALFPGIDSLDGLISRETGLDAETFLAADLYLFDPASPSAMGSFMSAGRIDNLASCFAAVSALNDAPAGADPGRLVLLMDAEESGSRIVNGADSILPLALLRRLVALAGGGEEELQRTLARSFLISADGAHAVHPNFASKHDPDFSPAVGGGPVVKIHAGYSYATRAEGAGRFITLCGECGVAYQRLIGRSDMKSGSTVGSILSAGLSVDGVDVGIPMLAMHSIRECADFGDLAGLHTVIARFFDHTEIA
jgi:aspartyl aminopeptidase